MAETWDITWDMGSFGWFSMVIVMSDCAFYGVLARTLRLVTYIKGIFWYIEHPREEKKTPQLGNLVWPSVFLFLRGRWRYVMVYIVRFRGKCFFKRETLLVTSQRIRLSTLAQTSLTVHVTSMHLQVDDDPTIIDVALRSDLCSIFLPVKTDQKREICEMEALRTSIKEWNSSK